MLIGNYSVINKQIGRFFAGSTISDNRSNFNTTNSIRNIYINSNISEYDGIPVGYADHSYLLPQKSGGLGARIESNSELINSNILVNIISTISSSSSFINIDNSHIVLIESDISSESKITCDYFLSPQNLSIFMWKTSTSAFDANTIGKKADDVFQMNFGKLIMIDNQLKLYNEFDTLIKTFNLYDVNYNPSITGVVYREPI